MSTGPQVVPAYDPFALASGGFESVQEDWMPASHCRPLVQEDPCVLWLEWYGDKYGFTPSTLNGFLLLDGGLNLIASNDPTLQILCFPSEANRIKQPKVSLADRVRTTLLDHKHQGGPVFVKELKMECAR